MKKHRKYKKIKLEDKFKLGLQTVSISIIAGEKTQISFSHLCYKGQQIQAKHREHSNKKILWVIIQKGDNGNNLWGKTTF